MAELLLSGCTTTTDHHYLFPAGLEAAIDIEVAAASRLGIRVVMLTGDDRRAAEFIARQLGIERKRAEPFLAACRSAGRLQRLVDRTPEQLLAAADQEGVALGLFLDPAVLARQAAATPDAPAVHWLGDDDVVVTWTYGDVRARSASVARRRGTATPTSSCPACR